MWICLLEIKKLQWYLKPTGSQQNQEQNLFGLIYPSFVEDSIKIYIEIENNNEQSDIIIRDCYSTERSLRKLLCKGHSH